MWLGIGIAILLALGYEAVIAIDPSADIFGSVYVRRVVILLLIFLGALPLLRLRGAYFAIATWLIAKSVSAVFNGWNVAGAGGGMQIKPEVTQLQLYYVALGLLAVTTTIIWAWSALYGRFGTDRNPRDDEDAAQTCGVDVGAVKAMVFLFSAAATGLAAGLYFIDVVIITPPSAFTISWAAYTVFIVVSGGMGTIAGPIVGAVLFIMIERLLGAIAGQGMLLLGALSILLMLTLPRGLMDSPPTCGACAARQHRRSLWTRPRASIPSRPKTHSTAGVENTAGTMTTILPATRSTSHEISIRRLR